MKNIRCLMQKLFFVIVALLLLPIQLPAAYRHKKANTFQQRTTQQTSNGVLLNENSGSASDGSRHLQTHSRPEDDKRENRRSTYAKVALFFGAGTIVSYLVAAAFFYGAAGGGAGYYLALLGFGLFGLLAAPLCALAALIFGLLGLKSKKHKKLAIAGLLMGVLAFIAATIILVA